MNPGIAAPFYGRGEAYDHKGEYDRAIQDFNEAIRLKPNFAEAYNARGAAWRNEGEYDRAIQSYSEAIRLNPNDALACNNRGEAYYHTGDYTRAIQNENEAIRLKPGLASASFNRGLAYFLQGNQAAAAADFEHAISASPSSRTAVMAALMLHIAMQRQGRNDAQQLARVAAAADLSKWPGPVLKLDLGQMTAAQVMASALKGDAQRQKWQVCEANYFTGEDALLHRQRTTALALLKGAHDGCPRSDGTYDAALAELKRLAATAAPAQ
jgi:Flp pilus assembly protein TadD